MQQLTLEEALFTARKAREKASQLNLSITISVVDSAGQLVLLMRGDNTGFLTVETSLGKARASAAFKLSTKEMAEAASGNNSVFWQALPGFADRVLPTTGAYPLFSEGKLLGAIGCGGGSPEQDHICAKFAASAFETCSVAQ